MRWQEINRIPARISSSLRLEVPEEAPAAGQAEGWVGEQVEGHREEWAAPDREERGPGWEAAAWEVAPVNLDGEAVARVILGRG